MNLSNFGVSAQTRLSTVREYIDVFLSRRADASHFWEEKVDSYRLAIYSVYAVRSKSKHIGPMAIFYNADTDKWGLAFLSSKHNIRGSGHSGSRLVKLLTQSSSEILSRFDEVLNLLWQMNLQAIAAAKPHPQSVVP
jgi:hypothetical protein